MKTLMLLVSLIMVAGGAYGCIIEKNIAGIVLVVMGGLCFLFFSSVKVWQYKADKSLYK